MGLADVGVSRGVGVGVDVDMTWPVAMGMTETAAANGVRERHRDQMFLRVEEAVVRATRKVASCILCVADHYQRSPPGLLHRRT